MSARAAAAAVADEVEADDFEAVYRCEAESGDGVGAMEVEAAAVAVSDSSEYLDDGSTVVVEAFLVEPRNERRKLPLPHDTACKACGFVWAKGSVSISRCEAFRSQCKVHKRLCSTRQ